jgi:hypothetical protein
MKFVSRVYLVTCLKEPVALEVEASQSLTTIALHACMARVLVLNYKI